MYISLNSIDILIMLSSCQYRYFFLCISVFLIDLKNPLTNEDCMYVCVLIHG